MGTDAHGTDGPAAAASLAGTLRAARHDHTPPQNPILRGAIRGWVAPRPFAGRAARPERMRIAPGTCALLALFGEISSAICGRSCGRIFGKSAQRMEGGDVPGRVEFQHLGGDCDALPLR